MRLGVLLLLCLGTCAVRPRPDLVAPPRPRGSMAVESAGYSRVALAYNVRKRDEVDALLDQVREAGARVVEPGEDTFWGGRSGYFADPEGFLWEVAWNPGFAIHDDGSIEMPQ